MARLIQLKNGDWIAPNAVTQVRALDGHDGSLGGYHSPRLIVHIGHNVDFIQVDYPTYEAACEARDRLVASIYKNGDAK